MLYFYCRKLEQGCVCVCMSEFKISFDICLLVYILWMCMFWWGAFLNCHGMKEKISRDMCVFVIHKEI